MHATRSAHDRVPRGRHRVPAVGRGRRGTSALLAASVGVVAATAGWEVAGAAFSTRTTDGANSLTTGTVVVTESRAGAALFTVTGLQPGGFAAQCLDVSYSGSLAASLKLRAALTPSGVGTLGNYLSVTVQEVTGTCTSFTQTALLFSGTAADLAATNATWATGLGTWNVPGGSPSLRRYRVRYQLRDDNAAQSLSTQLTLAWEARTT